MFEEDQTIRRDIRHLRKMSKKSPLLFARLAECYLRVGDQKRAEQLLFKGIEDYPDYTTAYQILAECHIYSCLYNEAESFIQTALAIDPQHLGLLTLLRKVKELQEEEKAFDDLDGKLNARDPFMHHELVSEINTFKDETEAQTTTAQIENPVEQESSSSSILPEPEVGGQATAETTATSPGVGDILALKRILEEEAAKHAALGTFDEPPLDDLSEAIPVETSEPAAKPRKKLATKTLGDLYANQQRYDEAIAIYQHLLEGDPDNQNYKERLSDLLSRREASHDLQPAGLDE
jgi:tetratricopeptide (TPR) repeat protein